MHICAAHQSVSVLHVYMYAYAGAIVLYIATYMQVSHR